MGTEIIEKLGDLNKVIDNLIERNGREKFSDSFES